MMILNDNHVYSTRRRGAVLAAQGRGEFANNAQEQIYEQLFGRGQFANAAQQQQPTTIVQQPAQQPPIVVQQPAPATQPAPVIINGQPAPSSGGTTTASGPDDSSIQAAVDKKLSDDPIFSTLGITSTVVNGKATLMGTVKTETLKSQVERAVRNVKGVKSVDNQISIG
jgi:hypothetical protein